MEDDIRNTLLVFLSKNTIVGIGFVVCKSLIDKYGLDNFIYVVGKMKEEKIISIEQLNNWSLPVIRRTVKTNNNTCD